MYEIVALIEAMATVTALSMFAKDAVRMLASKRAGGRKRVARGGNSASGQEAGSGGGPEGKRRRAREEGACGSPRPACSLLLSIRVRSATLCLKIGGGARDAGCGA